MSDNNLKKIKDEATIMSLISGAKESSLEIYIWKIIGNTKYLGQVKIESLRKSRKDFCIIPFSGQERAVQELMSGQSQIDIYVPDAALFLRCQIKQTDAPIRYYLHLPSFVAQSERRKSIRMNVYQDSDVNISFAKTVLMQRPMTQTFLKSCFDIGPGGMSFFVSKMEAKFFQEGDQVQNIEIKTSNWSSKVSAEITMIREVEPDEYNGLSYKVWKVCCRFTQIDQVSKKYLDKFVLERIKDELHVING